MCTRTKGIIDDHQSIVVWGSDRDNLQCVVDEVQQLADSLSLFGAALLVQCYEVGRDLESSPKLDYNSGAESVRVEIGQPHRYYLHLEVGVMGHGT